MPLITYYDTQDGIRRLLTCMFDLDAHAPWYRSDRSQDAAAVEYRQIFDAWRQLIQQAYDEAVPWWEDTVAAQEALGMSREDAIASAFNDRMAGAAADPRVVWIVRLIWLECANRNKMMPDSEKMRPEYLMLQWLIDAGETELVRLIACMPYWPIGIDETGDWC